MPQPEIVPATVEAPAHRFLGQPDLALPLALLGLGFLLRFGNAAFRFLNADEALHYLLSVQPPLAAAYRASLTTVHPPLLIVFLHIWGMLGHSEPFLRMPSVLAGTAFCWIMFAWLKRITNYETALIGLSLFLFSPALIQLSSEVRQYAFLLLFCASALYSVDWAIRENSTSWMAVSSVSLYLALLTHYSSLIFTLTLGIYALIRLYSAKPGLRVSVTWAGGQAIALALVAALYVTHVSKLRSTNAVAGLVGTYLRRSVQLPGENWLWFIGRSNLRFFHYLFSQGAVGAVALGLFIWGVVILVQRRNRYSERNTTRQLALLLVFPLVLNCGLALLRVYPYGGTRHNSYLAIFAISGIAIALAAWTVKQRWVKPAAIGVVILLCNLFPTPQGEYIRARDQKRKLMLRAVLTLSSLPPDSIIFTDDQGGLLLSYYLCGSKVAQIEQSPFQPFLRSRCGEHSVISIDPDWWIFKAETFPDTMRQLQQTYDLPSGTRLWLFQAGWFIDKEAELRNELRQYGCLQPHEFGRNIFLCEINADLKQ